MPKQALGAMLLLLVARVCCAPRTPGFLVAPAPEASSLVWRYQGGTKSPMTRN